MARTGAAQEAATASRRLNYSRQSWPLRVDLCPCDTEFVAWLRRRGIGGKAVFHFGTGDHHIVGRENAKLPKPNQVLGVTASPEEYARYIDLVIAEPRIANSYKAMFLDIYTLDPRGLPDFDVVALFHLCEFHDPKASSYAPLDDRRLLDLFLKKLRANGRICFYLGSNGRDAMLRLVDKFIAAGKLQIAEVPLPLLICRRATPGRAKAARTKDRARIDALLNA
jgi:hypothetical protein